MDCIPLILQYIVPGYWVMILFRFSTSKKRNEKTELIASCVISYILLSINSLIRIRWFKNLPDTALVNSALSFILGTLLVTMIAILIQKNYIKKAFVILFHKTINDNIWNDVFDLENGSNLKIYLKDKDYYIIGHHKNHEEKAEESWLAISAFAKFDKDTNKNYKNEPNYLNNENVIMTLRFSDIEHIEIF